jgi:hypothetical protein
MPVSKFGTGIFFFGVEAAVSAADFSTHAPDTGAPATARFSEALPRRSCSPRPAMQTLRMIIEMRTYKIKPRLRAEFLKTFEAKVRPAHRKIGMKILGPFLSVEDDDTFFWMRAFPDRKSRETMRDQFYEGKLFKDDLERNHVPMLEKYDVVVVEAKDGLGDWH